MKTREETPAASLETTLAPTVKVLEWVRDHPHFKTTGPIKSELARLQSFRERDSR